jgi:queuosine precursor transporter
LNRFNLFGNSDLSFQLTAGVLIWPIVFVLTDIINEYFGRKGVVRLSFLAVFMIAYAFIFVFLAINLVPADFWPTSHYDYLSDLTQKNKISSEVGNYNTAFGLVFGQGLKIIIASIIAFLIGQILDALIFHKIKLLTGDRRIWLRATGSTFISQFFDSYIVLFIAFYIGANWPLSTVLAIGTMNYIYKVVMAILLTPMIYFIRYLITIYLGKEESAKLQQQAMDNK